MTKIGDDEASIISTDSEWTVVVSVKLMIRKTNACSKVTGINFYSLQCDGTFE